MCLAVPLKIISISEDGSEAVAECMGIKKNVSLELLDEEAKIGDFILIHVGIAIRKIDRVRAEKTLEDHRMMAKIAQDLEK